MLNREKDILDDIFSKKNVFQSSILNPLMKYYQLFYNISYCSKILLNIHPLIHTILVRLSGGKRRENHNLSFVGSLNLNSVSVSSVLSPPNCEDGRESSINSPFVDWARSSSSFTILSSLTTTKSPLANKTPTGGKYTPSIPSRGKNLLKTPEKIAAPFYGVRNNLLNGI